MTDDEKYLITHLSEANKKLVTDLLKRYGFSFNENLKYYLSKYRKDIAKE